MCCVEGTVSAVGESRLSSACVQMEGDVLWIGKCGASQSRPCVSVAHRPLRTRREWWLLALSSGGIRKGLMEELLLELISDQRSWLPFICMRENQEVPWQLTKSEGHSCRQRSGFSKGPLRLLVLNVCVTMPLVRVSHVLFLIFFPLACPP